MANPLCTRCKNETSWLATFEEAYLVGPEGPGPKPTGALYLCRPCKLYYDEQGVQVASGRS